jgi:hypothetical protein
MTTTTPTTSTDAATVRIPRQGWEIDNIARPAPRSFDPRDEYPVATPRPALDATRLWAGGMASAVVAALVGLVGVLVVQVLVQVVPAAGHAGGAFSAAATTTLCLTAAGAALATTGLVHLLVVSTPRPLAYLGWIVGLVTAAAAVLPLVGGAPLAMAAAEGVINLVIGLAIGSLVAGAAAGAMRSGRTQGTRVDLNSLR